MLSDLQFSKRSRCEPNSGSQERNAQSRSLGLSSLRPLVERLVERPREAEKRNPGNEVAKLEEMVMVTFRSSDRRLSVDLRWTRSSSEAYYHAAWSNLRSGPMVPSLLCFLMSGLAIFRFALPAWKVYQRNENETDPRLLPKWPYPSLDGMLVRCRITPSNEPSSLVLIAAERASSNDSITFYQNLWHLTWFN